MTALGQLAPEFLVVSGNPTPIDRIRGGAVAEDLQVAWIGDNVRLERQGVLWIDTGSVDCTIDCATKRRSADAGRGGS